MDQNKSSSIGIPGAIIIAGAIIAVSIIWALKPEKKISTPTTDDTEKQQVANITVNLSPVTAADHILGNPNASIKFVEYTDPSCVFCKKFNPGFREVIDQFGPTGKVAWIYRHFPLDKPNANGDVLHPNAGHESQALECAATIGGNEKFWAFVKEIYSIDTSKTPGGLDQKQLPIIAKSVGVDVTTFNKCLSSGQTKDIVDADTVSGVNAGVSGTPTNFITLDKPMSADAEKYLTDSMIKYSIPADFLVTTTDKKTIIMTGALPKLFVSGLITALIGN